MGKRLVALLAALLFISCGVEAQTVRQTLRGQVFDQETHEPLVGALVHVTVGGESLGAAADEYGYFTIHDVPIGRHNVMVNYIGYEPVVLADILFTTGKETTLENSDDGEHRSAWRGGDYGWC